MAPGTKVKKVLLGFRWEQNRLYGEVFDYSEKLLLSLGIQSVKVSVAENPTPVELQNLTNSIQNIFQVCTNSGYQIYKVRYLGAHRSAARTGRRIPGKSRIKSMTPTTDHILKTLGAHCKAVNVTLKPKQAIPRTGIKNGQKIGKNFLAASRYLIATHLKSGLSRGSELAICAALELGRSEKSLTGWIEKIEKAKAKRANQPIPTGAIQQYQAAVLGKL